MENFTWDWVYQEYIEQHVRLKPHVDYLERLFREADYHIQTQPVCFPKSVDLNTLPVSRRARSTGDEVRQGLGIPEGAGMVLITMGGVPENYKSLTRLKLPEDLYLVVPGGSEVFRIHDHLITLPHNSNFFHPDLINAADAVVERWATVRLPRSIMAVYPLDL